MELYNHPGGAIAALASALCWAIAAVLFRKVGRKMRATAMNLGKGIIALVCLLFLIFPTPFQNLSTTHFWYLALSGLLGICIGDTLYFLSIQRIGARLTLLIGTLIPVVTALVAIVYFDEHLNWLALAGLMLTVAGVTLVLWNKAEPQRQTMLWLSGLTIAFLFVLTESAGILLTKTVVFEVSSIEATFIRQAWGVAGLVFWGLMTQSLVSDFTPLKADKNILTLFLLSSIIGAFLGTWLSILALKLTYASVAVALNSTSPLFVIPLAMWINQEKVTTISFIGAIFAVGGVLLYFFTLTG